MKNKKIILILLLFVGLFINVSKVNAKEINTNVLSFNQSFEILAGTATKATSKVGDITFGSTYNFICDEGDVNAKGGHTLRYYLRKYWSWIVFLVPLALIGFITYDFIKALSSKDSDSVKKASSDAVKRVISALLLLLAPYFVQVIFGWAGISFCFY